MMESYSQCGQDLFVVNILKKPGTFLDLGCYLPKKINNTYLLETLGWSGVSIDIMDYSKEWEIRSTKFIQSDCFKINYRDLIEDNFKNTETLDYLSIDMEKVGERYLLLENVLKSGTDFKIITIEHDGHLGENFINNEKIPQREILKKYGYELICSDISNKNDPELFYEDWWINPKYIKQLEVEKWKSDRISCDKIFEKMGIQYKLNEVSSDWSDY